MTFAQRVVAFSAGAEAATGLAAIAVPKMLGRLLLGAELPSLGVAVARCFGITLVALALAVWPDGDSVGSRSGPRAMLAYNGLIAAYLGWLGYHWRISGTLLWPAVALHVVVALLLAWSWRNVSD